MFSNNIGLSVNLNHPANIMPKEKSAVEMFLEGDENNQMFDNPTDPLEQPFETKDPDEKGEDKPLPFHKDPKIQKYLDRREKEMQDRLLASIGDKKPPANSSQDEFQEVITSFEGIIGNDTPEKINALNSLRKALTTMDDRSVRRAEEKIEEIRSREQKADKEAEQELETAFETIEETFDVDLTSSKATKVRQEFVTFVEKIAPKDRQGNIVDYPDMTSAWETFSEIKKSTQLPSRAKELANRSMARSTETAGQQPKKMDWNAVDEFMDTLK